MLVHSRLWTVSANLAFLAFYVPFCDHCHLRPVSNLNFSSLPSTKILADHLILFDAFTGNT